MGAGPSKPAASAPQGHVYFLPPKDEINESFLQDSTIDDGCFKHYVLVLDRLPDGKAKFLMMRLSINTITITSFGGRHLYEAREARHHGGWIPIAPYQDLKYGTTTLQLGGRLTFSKPSCVKIDTAHTLDFRVLRPLMGRYGVPYRLTAESFDVVLASLDKAKKRTITKSERYARPAPGDQKTTSWLVSAWEAAWPVMFTGGLLFAGFWWVGKVVAREARQAALAREVAQKQAAEEAAALARSQAQRGSLWRLFSWS